MKKKGNPEAYHYVVGQVQTCGGQNELLCGGSDNGNVSASPKDVQCPKCVTILKKKGLLKK